MTADDIEPFKLHITQYAKLKKHMDTTHSVYCPGLFGRRKTAPRSTHPQRSLSAAHRAAAPDRARPDDT